MLCRISSHCKLTNISRRVLWHGMSLKVERLKDEVSDVDPRSLLCQC